MRKLYIENINDIIINNDLVDIISYTDNKMKDISLKGWSLLSYIICKKYNIKLNKDMIYYNESKKPYFKDLNIYFNISHSKDLIAIIIDNKECGVDIEYIDYSKDLDKLVSKVLSKKEIRKYNIRKDKHKYFFKMWTKKETYYKYLGTGIQYKLLTHDIKYKNIKSYIVENKDDKYFVSFTK